MKNANAYDLLMTAPETQAARAKLIYNAIAKGEWDDAIFHLKNACAEECDSPWGMDAADLLGQCAMNGV